MIFSRFQMEKSVHMELLYCHRFWIRWPNFKSFGHIEVCANLIARFRYIHRYRQVKPL